MENNLQNSESPQEVPEQLTPEQLKFLRQREGLRAALEDATDQPMPGDFFYIATNMVAGEQALSMRHGCYYVREQFTCNEDAALVARALDGISTYINARAKFWDGVRPGAGNEFADLVRQHVARMAAMRKRRPGGPRKPLLGPDGRPITF